MSSHPSNAFQEVPLSPPPSNQKSIPEQSNKFNSPRHHFPIIPCECPPSPARISSSSAQEAHLDNVLPNCDTPAKASLEPRLALRDSIGRTALVVLLGGTALILASAAFLAFLWFGAGPTWEGESASWVWRRIALNGWTPQATTLNALVIQTIVAAQAAVCTSMLAGVILERGSVPRDKVAHLSIMRAASEGPISIVSLALFSKKLRMIARAEFFLGLLLLLETAVIQFSSTILLSDMLDTNLIGDVTTVPLQSFVSPNQQRITTTQHLFSVVDPNFAIYGEGRSNTTVMPNSHGLSDTGTIDRVLLPISKPQDRTAVRTYQGGAVVFSSRVACMRPEIRNFEFGQSFWTEHEGSNFGELNATLDYGLSLKNIGVDDACGPEHCPLVYFGCNLPGAYDGYGWQSIFCSMGGVGGLMWPFNEGPQRTVENEPWSINSSIFLVFSTNMKNSDWEVADYRGIFADGSLDDPVASEHEEWMSYEIMPTLFLNASLCFQTYSLEYSDVKLIATGDLMEPGFTYDSHTGGIDTSTVQTFFGTSEHRGNSDERGILQVREIQTRPFGDINDSQIITMNQLRTSIYQEIVSEPVVNSTRLACYHCSCGNVWPIHSELSQLLGNILNSTARAADMIQTYASSMAFTVYHQKQKTFVGLEDVFMSSVKTVLTAKSCRSHTGCWGLLSVIALIAVHLVIIVVSTALYVSQTRFSRQSNVWHAIAQLSSEDLRDIILESSNQSDKAFAQAIKKDGNNYTVRVGKLQGSGKVGVFRCE
ncbi:hypothetical protein NUW58_g3465 [Xylaria curta]|uniref:Uncharacterized protein n=1 Tax=Xylaria curta TaxID=42375 RepID=A0ACC1PAT4_9PEZI|nr:hypothetical protein NUW58_g3465 [Xylaria curta]